MAGVMVYGGWYGFFLLTFTLFFQFPPIPQNLDKRLHNVFKFFIGTNTA
jgi:hypothetical protein